MSVVNKLVAKSSVEDNAYPVLLLKHETETLLGEYVPKLEENKEGMQALTWKGQLLGIATQVSLIASELRGMDPRSNRLRWFLYILFAYLSNSYSVCVGRAIPA